jgi:hypothetical protein
MVFLQSHKVAPQGAFLNRKFKCKIAAAQHQSVSNGTLINLQYLESKIFQVGQNPAGGWKG